MMKISQSDVASEALDLPLEFMKLRKGTVFAPLLTTSLLLGALSQAGGNTPNYVFAGILGAVGMAVLWGGALTQRHRTERLRRHLQIEQV